MKLIREPGTTSSYLTLLSWRIFFRWISWPPYLSESRSQELPEVTLPQAWERPFHRSSRTCLEKCRMVNVFITTRPPRACHASTADCISAARTGAILPEQTGQAQGEPQDWRPAKPALPSVIL